LCILANGPRRFTGPAISRNWQHVSNYQSLFAESLTYGLSNGVAISGIIAPFPKFLSLYEGGVLTSDGRGHRCFARCENDAKGYFVQHFAKWRRLIKPWNVIEWL